MSAIQSGVEVHGQARSRRTRLCSCRRGRPPLSLTARAQDIAAHNVIVLPDMVRSEIDSSPASLAAPANGLVDDVEALVEWHHDRDQRRVPGSVHRELNGARSGKVAGCLARLLKLMFEKYCEEVSILHGPMHYVEISSSE